MKVKTLRSFLKKLSKKYDDANVEVQYGNNHPPLTIRTAEKQKTLIMKDPVIVLLTDTYVDY